MEHYEKFVDLKWQQFVRSDCELLKLFDRKKTITEIVLKTLHIKMSGIKVQWRARGILHLYPYGVLFLTKDGVAQYHFQ